MLVKGCEKMISSLFICHGAPTLVSEKTEQWALEFDDWFIEKVEDNDKDALFNYRKLAPYAKHAVPREEHIVPMFIAMGSGNRDKPKLLHQSYAYGTLSYICFEF